MISAVLPGAVDIEGLRTGAGFFPFVDANPILRLEEAGLVTVANAEHRAPGRRLPKA